jgi:hypothetical protein
VFHTQHFQLSSLLIFIQSWHFIEHSCWCIYFCVTTSIDFLAPLNHTCTSSYLYTISSKIHNNWIFPQNIMKGSEWFSEWTTIVSLNRISRKIIVMATHPRAREIYLIVVNNIIKVFLDEEDMYSSCCSAVPFIWNFMSLWWQLFNRTFRKSARISHTIYSTYLTYLM